MLIKQADDRTRDIQALTRLLDHPEADTSIKKKIEQELRTFQSGIKGEGEAAYEIDFYFEQSKNWAVLHDLRLEHSGRVAQIDHLLVNRLFEIWVCESKRFCEGIKINEHGECSMIWKGNPTGIASPYEQNAKHIAVLKAACDSGAVALPRRLGFAIKPSFNNLVLVSKNARVTRPDTAGWWDRSLLKADQIQARLIESPDDVSVLQAAKIISSDTLEAFAELLASHHVPASFDWHAKFGLSRQPAAPAKMKAAIPASDSASPANKPPRAKEAVCSACGISVEDKVVAYCVRFNKARFGGNVYCRECQQKVPVPA